MPKFNKISVITPTYNAAATLGDTLRSVADQRWGDVEHIIIDGASKDNTAALVDALQRPGGQFISERDNGLYDAMNKGIDRASGDIICLLNADDFYSDDEVLQRVAGVFEAHDLDAVLGDVGFVRDGALDTIIRRYNSSRFRPSRLAWGWMPAHPAMFLSRAAYERVGRYRTDYKIAADFEFVIRAFVQHQLRYLHIPQMLVTMRTGGVSTAGLRSKWIINKESLRACRENGIYSNHLMLASKYPAKLLEFVR